MRFAWRTPAAATLVAALLGSFLYIYAIVDNPTLPPPASTAAEVAKHLATAYLISGIASLVCVVLLMQVVHRSKPVRQREQSTWSVTQAAEMVAIFILLGLIWGVATHSFTDLPLIGVVSAVIGLWVAGGGYLVSTLLRSRARLVNGLLLILVITLAASAIFVVL